jgi:hypothetical protein
MTCAANSPREWGGTMPQRSIFRREISAVCALLAAVVFAAARSAEPPSDEAAVLKVVQEFFDAMAARDAEAMRRITLPEGRFFSVRETEGEVRLRSFTNAESAGQLAAAQERWLERMWNPQVLIHKRIAVVWTPYDFYRDARFSHCGIDAFNLIKTGDGWKITGGVYTVEPAGCDPSPLGPPQPGEEEKGRR